MEDKISKAERLRAANQFWEHIQELKQEREIHNKFLEVQERARARKAESDKLWIHREQIGKVRGVQRLGFKPVNKRQSFWSGK